MDAYLGKKLNLHGFMSQSVSAANVPESAKELIGAMKMQDVYKRQPIDHLTKHG